MVHGVDGARRGRGVGGARFLMVLLVPLFAPVVVDWMRLRADVVLSLWSPGSEREAETACEAAQQRLEGNGTAWTVEHAERLLVLLRQSEIQKQMDSTDS